MAPKTVWCFYTVQNDAGDSADNPNAFRVRFAGEVPTLADVRASFPLRHGGSFHFRFRLAAKGGKDPKAYVHLDAVRDEDAVPRFGQHLIARVLRLDNLTTVSRRAVALRRRAVSRAALPATRASASAAAAAPSAPAAPAAPAASAADASAAARMTPEELEDSKLPPLPPGELDDDLKGKDPAVASRIQRRRNRQAAKVTGIIGGLRGAAATEAAASEERFRVKAELKPVLDAWAHESGGSQKDIRALLVRLPDVLWEGATWKPVTMGEVLAPNKVKIAVRRAQLVVHPDKLPSLGVRERYIAEIVFDTLQQAYHRFEDSQ
ncbi:hypothetical protein FNF29_02950 [Cafeteria roenbergensis]|uniref:J domain-containing protein n=1 Tax=Cafeteria roenbergensis TaxID=33653 RepID=A0A5A8CP80_CAFRO|nr:hypothetical protein FNF29_02950 [Cafeteria roenbergensis]|eukprot:KAA0153561.1 hypothetical protein FNF29_02950 [Cafeteria roenbergensis]